jgi:hypothetical protein
MPQYVNAINFNVDEDTPYAKPRYQFSCGGCKAEWDLPNAKIRADGSFELVCEDCGAINIGRN